MLSSMKGSREARSSNGDEDVCEQFLPAQEEFEPPSEDLATHAQQFREMQTKLESVQLQLRMLQDSLMGPAAAEAAASAVAGLDGPEHVLLQDFRVPAAVGHAETELERKIRELQAKQQQLIQEERKQEEERLLVSLAQPMGFYKGKPLAALVVFRCCLQWRAFQADRTSVFDKLIQVIGSQIERLREDNACLAYGLTNTVTLLHLLQRNIKPASGSDASVKRVAAAASRSIMGGLFGRQPMGDEAAVHGGAVGGFRLVVAKYPALLFKQQLDAFVQKIFPMMRDNVKKTITPMLGHCIHTPRGAHGRGAAASSRRKRGVVAPGSGSGTSAHSKAWSDILQVFGDLLVKLRVNHVPKPLVQALFKQLFIFVNVQLFNQLLLRRECCSFSNGVYVKTGLAQVESWIMEHGTEWVGESWDELKYIRQAVAFLVVGNKPKKTLDDITKDLCPVLSIQQLYRISTMYWDDKYNAETVSSKVLGRMKQAMVEHSSSASHSFLLDDDSTLPFAADDILAQMDDKDLYIGLPVPEPLKQASDGAASFAFLEKELRFGSM